MQYWPVIFLLQTHFQDILLQMCIYVHTELLFMSWCMMEANKQNDAEELKIMLWISSSTDAVIFLCCCYYWVIQCMFIFVVKILLSIFFLYFWKLITRLRHHIQLQSMLKCNLTIFDSSVRYRHSTYYHMLKLPIYAGIIFQRQMLFSLNIYGIIYILLP